MAKGKSSNDSGRLVAILGNWSFIIGIALAVVMGLFSSSTPTNLLLILGTIVGLLNVTEKEIIPFLVATVALMVSGLVSPSLPMMLGSILNNIVVFVVPAAVIASVKAIYALASTK